MDADQLLTAWHQARSEGLNNHAAAAKLGLSEAGLIASGCGRFVTRLLPDAAALLRGLPRLGKVKAVVRNSVAVLERVGTVHAVVSGAIGSILVAADSFEMLCEIAQWKRAFALREESTHGHGLKLSVQFFTVEGTSAAKFFLPHGSDAHAFAQLTGAFASLDQSSQEPIDFAPERLSLPWGRPTPAAPDALLAFLQTAAQSRLPLTFVVRNRAACLYASKAIEHVKRSDRGGWVNVLDEGMDVHLHESRIPYLRYASDFGSDGRWLHWYSDQQTIALSVRCSQGWRALTAAAGAAS